MSTNNLLESKYIFHYLNLLFKLISYRRVITMRKLFTISFVLFAFFINCNLFSQILLDENFDYPVGDSLVQHGWVWFSGNAFPILVVAPGLTFPTYPLSGIGHATRVRNYGNDNYKAFSTADSTGDLYVSFMVKIDSASTGDYFLALLPNTSTTFYCGRVYAKDSAGMIAFGLSKFATSQGPLAYSPAVYQYATTYLLVLKYEFRPGTMDDTASLYVFSSNLPAAEPSAPTVGPMINTSGNDPANLGRVALRQGTSSSSPTLNLDGIRVATSWGQLTTVNSNTNKLPEKFYLSQNYPNPFNPSTKIDIAVPDESYVTLKVYDELGKNIAVLVDKKLISGFYSYTFNAVNLPSGVYFYQLFMTETNGRNIFSDTKSMVLIK